MGETLRRLELLETPQQIQAPPGMVYSTDPHKAMAEDGTDYILKGPETSVVFAEAAAYELANLLEVPIPPHAGCMNPGSGNLWFGSREMPVRGSVDRLLERDRIQNPMMIPRTIVFDVWIGNRDRNLGNFVGGIEGINGTNAVKLRAIDFEKAEVLRGHMDQFSITAIAPDEFWPVDELGALCEGFALPEEFCGNIERLVEDDRVDGVLNQLVWDLDFAEISWLDAAVHLLENRGRDIRMWAQEAWHD